MKIDFEELKKDSALIVGSVRYHWEKRKTLYAYALVSVFVMHSAYSGFVSYYSDESKRVRNVEYHESIRQRASSDLSSSVTKTLEYKSQLAYAEDCIKANEKKYSDCASLESGAFEVKFVKVAKEERKSEPVPTVSAAESEPQPQPQPPRYLSPSELLGPTKVSDKCYVSQTESEHVVQKNGGMFATDIACNFGEGIGKRAEVYAPDLRDKSVKFKVAYVGHDDLLGSFVQLVYMNPDYNTEFPKLWDESFYLGHTETKLKVGDEVLTGQRIGQMVLNGATTGWHVHFEYRRLGVDGKTWKSERYFTGAREEALDNKRKGSLPSGWKWGDTFYFTHYDLGDVNQNDSAPCNGASGKNLCDLEKLGTRTVALTVDVRNALGIKFGDEVRLEGPCLGTYRVEDEMNQRFRYACVKRDGFCIKGDIPSCNGGVHSIHKI